MLQQVIFTSDVLIDLLHLLGIDFVRVGLSVVFLDLGLVGLALDLDRLYAARYGLLGHGRVLLFEDGMDCQV